MKEDAFNKPRFKYFISRFYSNYKNIVVVALLILIFWLFLENYSLKHEQNKESVELGSNSCKQQVNIYKEELATCKEDYEVRLRQDQAIQQQIDELRDMTKYEPSSKRCKKKADIWSYLPEGLKSRTYKKGAIAAGASTYDMIPLNWSDDCTILPFLIELVGREADAYEQEDFKPRGLYLFNDIDKKIRSVFILDKDLYIDNSVNESNFWFQGKYIFVASTSEGESVFTKKRYEYDPKIEKLSLK